MCSAAVSDVASVDGDCSGVSTTGVVTDTETDLVDSLVPHIPTRKRSPPSHLRREHTKRRRAAAGLSRFSKGIAVGDASSPAYVAGDDEDNSPVSTNTVVHTNSLAAEDGSASQRQFMAAFSAAADDGSMSEPGRSRPRTTARSQSQRGFSQQSWTKAKFVGEPREPCPTKGIGYAGQICRVELQNFMCHENLDLPISSSVVLICGTNGSGKSAVLNAIQLCLGARATDTGRNHKFSDFIRTVPAGSDSPPNTAVASVTIWNTGSDAYHYETFGDTITVVKRISSNSVVTRLLDQNGCLVCQGKEHVERMLEHMGVEAKNKAVCMSQETCRVFASDFSGRQKFDLYMDATHLRKTRDDHIKSEGAIKATSECTTAAKKQLKEKRKELETLRGQLASLQEVAPLQTLHNAVHNCMAWAHVAELQNVVETRRHVAEVELPRQLVEATDQESEIRHKLESVEHERNPKVEQLEALEPQVRDMADQQRAAHTQERQACKFKSAAESAYRRKCEAASDAEVEAANFAEECQAQEADLNQQSQTAHQRFQTDLAAARQDVRARGVEKETLQQQFTEATAAKNQSDAALRHARATKADAVSQVEQLRQVIHGLHQRKGNPIMAFGGHPVLKLMERIEHEVHSGVFHRPPLGPIGALLTLTDEKWAVAVEGNCGKHLSSFLVHDWNDLNHLKGICRSLRVATPTIVVSNFDTPLHNLASRPQPPAHVLTMLKVLRVQPGPQQHTIVNFLIDKGLERAALVDGDGRATREFMDGPDSRLVSTAWDPRGNYAYNRKSSRAFIANNRPKPPRLTQDVSGLLAAESARLQAAEGALAAADAACREAEARHRAIEAAFQSAIRAKNTATRAFADSQAEEAELMERGPDLEGMGAPGDTERFAAEKADYAALLRREAAEAEAQLQQAVADEDRLKADNLQLEARSRELQATCENINQEIEALTRQRDELLGQQDQWVQRKEALEQKCAAIEALVSQLSDTLQDNKGIASQICSEEEGQECRKVVVEYLCGRGPVPLLAQKGTTPQAKSAPEAERIVLSTADLQLLKDAMKRRIDQCHNSAGGNLDELEVLKGELELLVSRCSTEVQVVNANLLKEKAGINSRMERYDHISYGAEKQLTNDFSTSCAKRNLVGSIHVNDEKQILTLNVDTDASQQDRRLTQSSTPNGTKSGLGGLSGGEKSVTTLCFALALQSVVTAPFYCLDEFDVYMDSVNRTMVLRLLLDAALENSERQLILFSPQDTDAVTKAMSLCERDGWTLAPNFVKIIRMKPARDNATAA